MFSLCVELSIAVLHVFGRGLCHADTQALCDDLEFVGRDCDAGFLRCMDDAVSKKSVFTDQCYEIVADSPALLSVLPSRSARVHDLLARARRAESAQLLGDLLQKRGDVIGEHGSRQAARRQRRSRNRGHELRNDTIALAPKKFGQVEAAVGHGSGVYNPARSARAVPLATSLGHMHGSRLRFHRRARLLGARLPNRAR
jgi:hypothetical protein